MKRSLTFFLLALLTSNIKGQQSYSVSFVHDGKTVHGTFTTPDGNCKFPTVIINPGSGANNRDGTIPLTDGNSACLFPSLYGDTLKIYKELGDALVDSGYAVLRYDKLEYTYPTNLGTITFHKLWLPVESAIKYIKTRSDVDTNKIILIGHSEGSSLIPFIAKGRSDIKALISLAGARTPFDSLFAWQLNNLISLLRPCGATANDSISAANQANQVLSYFNVIRTNTWNGSTPPLFGVPASAWYNYVLATDPVATNYNLDGLPTLFVGMGLDIQVPPSELTRFQNEVTITTDFWSMPGLIHYMTPNNDPHVSKALTDTIIHWLRKQNFSFKCHQFVGIHPNLLKDDDLVKVYPNPFNSAIAFSISKRNVEDFSFTVRNILGEVILYSEENGPTDNYSKIIDLSGVVCGVYFLEFHVDGHKTMKKITKE
jgi:dienelactone hydrolase